MTILRGDKVALVREFGKLTQIGTVYEVANITTDNNVVIRDIVSKIAVGAIGIDDFEKHFNKFEDAKKSGWTEWHLILDSNDDAVGIYRTNYKKVEIRIYDEYGKYVIGKAFCNKGDVFNLAFGMQLAYFRAMQKHYIKNKEKLINELNDVKLNIYNIEQQIRKMCEG